MYIIYDENLMVLEKLIQENIYENIKKFIDYCWDNFIPLFNCIGYYRESK